MNVKLFMVMIKESMLRVYYTENTSFMAAVCVNVTLLRVDGYNVMVKTCGHFMNIWHAVRRDCVWADVCQVQAMYHLRTTVFGGMCARFKQCTISELLCLGWCVPGSSNVPSQNCVWADVCQFQAMYHLRTVFGVICARFKQQCTISELCLGWYVLGLQLQYWPLTCLLVNWSPIVANGVSCSGRQSSIDICVGMM